MALTSFGVPWFIWPGFTDISPNNPSAFAVRTPLDAAGEYHAIVFQAREDMTISHVGWYNGIASGSPTVDIRIETVDVSNAQPSGSLWATDTNVVTGTLTSNTWAVYALTAPATVTRGQLFAVKIAYNSGTSVTVVEYSALPGQLGGWSIINTGSPSGGSFINIPASVGSSATAMYQLRGPMPINALGTAAFNNTGGARRGAKFQLPFECRAAGVRFVAPSSITTDFNIGIWDDAGNEVGSTITSIDRSSFNFANAVTWQMMFDTPVTLLANTSYRVAVEPTSASNFTMYHMTVASAALRSGLPGGTSCQLTTYTTGGGWDDSATTTVPWFDIVIDQIHDGAGAGGGARQKVYGG